MKSLLAPLFTMALAAQPFPNQRGPQIWEKGLRVLTTLDLEAPLPFLARGRQSLIALDSHGKAVSELRLPGSLRWPSLSHWNGRSFAYGFPTHPAWHFPDLGKRAWGFPPQAFSDAYQRSEQHLYLSTDFQHWKLLARYRPGEDSHGHIRRMLPLEDGSFLAFGIRDFWELDRVSPVARYRVDARGHLMFEHLVELGLDGIYDTVPHPPRPGQNAIQARPGYEGIEKQDWLTARTPEGLVLIHRGGWYFVLDNRNGHYLREGRIPTLKDRAVTVLDAEPDPNGRILVASTLLRGVKRTALSPFPRPSDSPSMRLARQLMFSKEERGRLINDLEGPTALSWHRLEVGTGRLSDELPPQGGPTSLKSLEARWGFRFTIRADGNLEIPRQRNARRWWEFP